VVLIAFFNEAASLRQFCLTAYATHLLILLALWLLPMHSALLLLVTQGENCFGNLSDSVVAIRQPFYFRVTY
jgi:hypothetical protein